MSSEAVLGVPEVDINQTLKTATVNAAIAGMAKAIGALLTIDASIHATPYTIPFNGGTDEPTGDKTALRFGMLNVIGAIGADWTAYMPGGGYQKPFFVQNSTTGGFNVKVMVAGQTGVTLPPGGAGFMYLNGTDVINIPTNISSFGSNPYDLSFFFQGVQTVASQVLMRYVATRAVLIPANFGAVLGSQTRLDCRVAAAGSTTLTVQKALAANTTSFSSIGSIVVNAASRQANTLSTSGGVAQSLAAGDVMQVVGPATPDGALADMAFTFAFAR